MLVAPGLKLIFALWSSPPVKVVVLRILFITSSPPVAFNPAEINLLAALPKKLLPALAKRLSPGITLLSNPSALLFISPGNCVVAEVFTLPLKLP